MSPSQAIRRLTVLLLASAAAACAGEAAPEASQTRAAAEGSASNRGQAFIKDSSAEPNILNIALGSEDHTTLVAAVQAAGMENVLVNAGPLTVFAPVNAAFDALPDGALDDLLKAENQPLLYKVISSHASPGKFTVEQLRDGQQLYQASGHYVDVEKRDGETYVNGARILGSVNATNGVVHVVDQVFLVALES